MLRASTLAAALVLSGSVVALQIRAPADATLRSSKSPTAATLDSASYSRAVADVVRRLEHAAQSPKSTRLAQQALDALPKRPQIQSSDAPLTVDNSALLDALREQAAAGPAGIRDAARTLRNLQHGLSARPQPLPEGARQALAAVLNRREFKPGPLAALGRRLEHWITRINRVIQRVIMAIFDLLARIAPAVPSRFWRALLTVMLIAAGALALYLVVRLVILMAPREGRAGAPQAVERTPMRSHRAWLADAEAALQGQDYGAAVRALHMAALMRLDEAGLVSYADSRADGRFEQALREAGRYDLADALATLSRLFSTIWYGLAPAGPPEYAAARQHWNRLEAMTAA